MLGMKHNSMMQDLVMGSLTEDGQNEFYNYLGFSIDGIKWFWFGLKTRMITNKYH